MLDLIRAFRQSWSESLYLNLTEISVVLVRIFCHRDRRDKNKLKDLSKTLLCNLTQNQYPPPFKTHFLKETNEKNGSMDSSSNWCMRVIKPFWTTVKGLTYGFSSSSSICNPFKLHRRCSVLISSYSFLTLLQWKFIPCVLFMKYQSFIGRTVTRNIVTFEVHVIIWCRYLAGRLAIAR